MCVSVSEWDGRELSSPTDWWFGLAIGGSWVQLMLSIIDLVALAMKLHLQSSSNGTKQFPLPFAFVFLLFFAFQTKDFSSKKQHRRKATIKKSKQRAGKKKYKVSAPKASSSRRRSESLFQFSKSLVSCQRNSWDYYWYWRAWFLFSKRK